MNTQQINRYCTIALAVLSLATVAAATDPNCTMMQSDIVTFYVGIETARPDPNVMDTVEFGHTDLQTPYRCDSGHCRWDFAVAPNGRRIAPQNALLYANPNARITMPASSVFAFIGAAPGQTVWVLPQSASPGVLHLGFSSDLMNQEVNNQLCLWDPNDPRGGANKADKWLRVELVEVRGPQDGHVSMWTAHSGATATVFYSTYLDGITADDVYHYPVGAHTHMNWGFTQPGFYELDLRVSTYYRCADGLTADLNGDCVVNLHDYALLAMAWLRDDCQAPDWCDRADILQTGHVDLDDLTALADQWLLCGSPFVAECP